MALVSMPEWLVSLLWVVTMPERHTDHWGVFPDTLCFALTKRKTDGRRNTKYDQAETDFFTPAPGYDPRRDRKSSRLFKKYGQEIHSVSRREEVAYS